MTGKDTYLEHHPGVIDPRPWKHSKIEIAPKDSYIETSNGRFAAV